MLSCTPGGPAVNEGVSRNHFYGLLRRSVTFSYGGNCLGPGCTVIQGADAETFEPLSPLYARDAQHVFFEARMLQDEEPARFRVLAGPYAAGRLAYFRGQPLTEADTSTFSGKTIESGSVQDYWASDARAVFCREKVISTDPAHFHPLEHPNYFADSGHVYFMSGGVCHRFDASPGEFEFLHHRSGSRSSYARDRTHVYMVPGTRRLSGADPSTFRPLCINHAGKAWAFDAERVYLFDRVAEGALPGRFEVPGGCAD